MRRFVRYTACVFFFALFSGVMAQGPANDNCEKASEIVISANGYGTGKFISEKADVSLATRQVAEHCVSDLEEVGNCTKTVWYKFYIPTTRNVSIELTQQDSSIPQIFAGFNIYRVPDCSYTLSDIEKGLPPLNKFGVSGNSCLSQGWYLVQVGCKKRAKGALWINLSVSYPATDKYDNLNGFYDFGLVNNGQKSGYVQFDCKSIEPFEQRKGQDSSMSKSVWLSVRFPAYSIFNLIGCNYDDINLYGARLQYRVFADTVTADSFINPKPLRDITAGGTLWYEECPLNNKSEKRYFVQIVSDEFENYISVNTMNSTYTADLWNTTNTDVVVDVDFNYIPDKRHYLNCEGLLKNHSCKNVIPSYYIRNYKEGVRGTNKVIDISDTFRYGTYSVLNVLEDGILYANTQYGGVRQMVHYSLYAGDVRNTCNLVLMADEFIQEDPWTGLKYCIGKGTYTLVTSYMNLSEPERSLKVSLSRNTVVPKYYSPLQPERVKDFNPLKDNWFSSEKINYKFKDTVITVDTVTISGRMTFKEIFITASSDLNIVSQGYGGIYLFVGRISQGTAMPIVGVDYRNAVRGFGLYSSLSLFGTSNYGHCFSLPKGFYTVISVLSNNDYSIKMECAPTEHWVNFLPNANCPVTNNTEPQFALPVNGNQDVLTATGNLKGLSYTFTLPYCKDCKHGSVTKPAMSCNTKAGIQPSTTFYYFTFYLGQNASFEGPGLSELYRGNAMLDPGIVRDSNNIVSPCLGGNTICNLEGNRYYTLMVPMNIDYSREGAIYFTPHRYSENDFAAHAYDFGHFTGTDNRQSSFVPITCHTNGLSTDPRQYSYFSNKGSSIIPYKDTLNLRRSQGVKNLWYTFTVSGSSKLKLNAVINNVNGGYGNFEVFRYKGNYEQDFKKLLSKGFDSTSAGMTYIGGNSYGNKKDFEFYNSECLNNRYFVLVNNGSGNNREYALIVSNEPLATSTIGDHCSDAVTGTYQNYGSYSLKTNNACHTYGNSPGESVYQGNVKSTWFKISVSNLAKFDLQIQSLKGNRLLSYSVYGGTCKAMTKITNGGNGYAYFTLNCMGSGNYYIQALYSTNNYGNLVNEDVEFGIKIIDPAGKSCKPYDFKYPIALFKIKGGCNKDDTIRLVNQSTFGEDITCRWFINGNFLSQQNNPWFTRRDPGLKDSNWVKLIVLNTNEYTSDTFDLLYYRDTTLYQFKITGPSISYCYDTLLLKSVTNYPGKMNYAWYWYNNAVNILSSKSTYSQNRTARNRYVLQGESENCNFTDTFTVNVISTLHRYKDTNFCQGQRYVIKNNTGDYMYINSKELYQGDSAVYLTSAGLYVNYRDKSCSYYDSVQINVEMGPKVLFVKDTIYACNVSSYKIQYTKEPLLKYTWSTGDTSPFIQPSQNGKYRLTGAFSKCRNLDWTTFLTLENINIDRLKDTVMCKYDMFNFRNPYDNSFKILQKVPKENSLKILTPLKVKLNLQKSKCLVNDSSLVSMFPFAGRTIDSFLCDRKPAFYMVLDGGNAQQYNWYQNNGSGRYLSIPDYGNYPVARVDLYGCKDTLNYNIITNCEFTVFMPDAFTPNDDVTNELFGPVISGLHTGYKMSLYNCWGEMVFHTDKSNHWDGKYEDKLVSTGVYCYLLTVYDKNHQPFVFKGTVTILY